MTALETDEPIYIRLYHAPWGWGFQASVGDECTDSIHVVIGPEEL